MEEISALLTGQFRSSADSADGSGRSSEAGRRPLSSMQQLCTWEPQPNQYIPKVSFCIDIKYGRFDMDKVGKRHRTRYPHRNMMACTLRRVNLVMIFLEPYYM